MPPQGGSLQLRAVLGNTSAADRDVAPAIDQATYWARHNGCGEPVRAETPASSKTEWTSCRSGAPVVFHSVKGNGHAWPGGQPGREGAATSALQLTDILGTAFGTGTAGVVVAVGDRVDASRSTTLAVLFLGAAAVGTGVVLLSGRVPPSRTS